jgi:DNA-directed RNA polymerase specialized sigma24 family protein
MSDAEYNDLVRNATAKRHMVVHALQKKHFDVEAAVIEDCVESAIVKFSDREKILHILKPHKPFRWLLSTAERIYQRERRKHSKEIPLDELAVEPTETDREIESYEASEYTDAIFGMIHKNYSDILIAIERDGFSFDEIAKREGKPVKAIYNRYERAKIKAKEATDMLEPKSPPQQE